MTFIDVVNILARWLHVIAAILAVGGAFFLRVILPIGTVPLDPEQREAVLLRCRRGLKMIVHPAVLLLIVTGAYNWYRNRPWYNVDPAPMHGLFGTHLLLGLIVIG